MEEAVDVATTVEEAVVGVELEEVGVVEEEGGVEEEDFTEVITMTGR